MISEKGLIGDYPVIGIRPIIDARKGVLNVGGSLGGQTMAIAQAAKQLPETSLKYTDGSPVRVIIADQAIGRMMESAACAGRFKKEGVDITLSVTPCWCYESETMDMDPMTIKGAWGLNVTERPGAVYLASVLAGHGRKRLPAFGIYGKGVQDTDSTGIPKDVQEKLLRFGRVAVATATMRGKSYPQIGAACMGISGSAIDPDSFEEYLDMKVESVNEVGVLRRIKLEIYDQKEYERALAWTKEKHPERFDKDPEHARHTRGQKEKNWEFTVKCALMTKDLVNGNKRLAQDYSEEMLGHNALAAGFQGQRQWTDYLPNTDPPEAILSSSSDWSGARGPYILATEDDTLNGASMLFLKLLANHAQMFADVRTCQSGDGVRQVTGHGLEGHAEGADGFTHLISPGACCLDACAGARDGSGEPMIKPFWEISKEDVDACLEATTWCEADLGYSRGGGYSSRFETKYGVPIIMIRLNITKGIGPVVQIVERWNVGFPKEVSDMIWKRADYTWPCTQFAPRTAPAGIFKSTYDVMSNWKASHGTVSYGRVEADTISLCPILRIPICMRSVSEEIIFHPACQNTYEMDKERQDFRVCTAYGPLYKQQISFSGLGSPTGQAPEHWRWSTE